MQASKLLVFTLAGKGTRPDLEAGKAADQIMASPAIAVTC